MVVNSKIIKVLIKTGLGNIEEILTRTLFGRVKDVNNIVASQVSKE